METITLYAALMWTDEFHESAIIKYMKKNELGGINATFSSDLMDRFIYWADEDEHPPKEV